MDFHQEYKYVNIVLSVFFSILFLFPIPFAINSENETDFSNADILVMEDYLPKCAIFEKTGMYCPSCGLTRSVIALYKFNYKLSVFYNPSGILFVSIVLFQLIFRIFLFIKSSKWMPIIDVLQLMLTGCILNISFYIL